MRVWRASLTQSVPPAWQENGARFPPNFASRWGTRQTRLQYRVRALPCPVFVPLLTLRTARPHLRGVIYRPCCNNTLLSTNASSSHECVFFSEDCARRSAPKEWGHEERTHEAWPPQTELSAATSRAGSHKGPLPWCFARRPSYTEAPRTCSPLLCSAQAVSSTTGVKLAGQWQGLGVPCPKISLPTCLILHPRIAVHLSSLAVFDQEKLGN